MSLYTVKTDPNQVGPRFNGTDSVITSANSTAEAIQIGKNYHDGDSDALWAGATVTDASTITNLQGWTFNIAVNTSSPVNVTYVGVANDTVTTALTALTALVLTAVGVAISGTAHSAYNSSTRVLTVSSIADGIGDKTLTVTITPPTGLFATGYTWTQADFVASKVNAGSSGAVLTVTFVTTWVPPGLVLAFKQ